jgi:hypothetical protein
MQCLFSTRLNSCPPLAFTRQCLVAGHANAYLKALHFRKNLRARRLAVQLRQLSTARDGFLIASAGVGFAVIDVGFEACLLGVDIQFRLLESRAFVALVAVVDIGRSGGRR